VDCKEVSYNDTPNHLIQSLAPFSIETQWFWGTSILRNTHIVTSRIYATLSRPSNMIFSVLPTPLAVAGVLLGRPAIRDFRIAKAPGDRGQGGTSMALWRADLDYSTPRYRFLRNHIYPFKTCA
jgi:hypothetical protein